MTTRISLERLNSRPSVLDNILSDTQEQEVSINLSPSTTPITTKPQIRIGMKYEQVEESLRDRGIEISKVFGIERNRQYVKYVHGVTSLGNSVLIDFPEEIRIDTDIISIKKDVRDSGLTTKAIIEEYKQRISDFPVGLAFISSSGIQTITKVGKGETYIFTDYFDTKSSLNIRKFSYNPIAFVRYEDISPPSVLNTVDAYLEKEPVLQGFRNVLKAQGFRALLNSEDVTVLAPYFEYDYGQYASRDVLGSHIILGKDLGPGEYRTLSGERITINQDMSIKEMALLADRQGRTRISKSNGDIYLVSGIIIPQGGSETFELSDPNGAENIVTIFDIERATMLIFQTQFDLNRSKHQDIIDLSQGISETIVKIQTNIDEYGAEKGKELMETSHAYNREFFSLNRGQTTQRLQDLESDLKERSRQYELVMNESNRSSMAFHEIEKLAESLVDVLAKLQELRK